MVEKSWKNIIYLKDFVCRPLSKHFLYLSNPDFHPFHGKTLFSFSFQICEACGASRCSLRFSRANYCARILVQSTAVQSDSFANYTSLWDSFGAVRISAQDWISKFIKATYGLHIHAMSYDASNLNQLEPDTPKDELSTKTIVYRTFQQYISNGWFGKLRSRAFQRYLHVRV